MHPLVNYFWQGRSVLKRQKDAYFDDAEKTKKSDYVGAIYYGIFKKGYKESSFVVDAINSDWPQIRYWTDVPCGCDSEGGRIASILIHLNDDHDARQWSDKRISEWLDATLDGKAYPSKEEYDKTHLP